jgi:hypothetical protein
MSFSLDNIHQESIGSCTSIDFTAAAEPGADGVQAVHWFAREGVISRHSPAPLPNLQAVPEKVLESGWFKLPIVAAFVADTLAAMPEGDR